MKSPTRLTDIAVRNLKPKVNRYEVPDPGARGLYVIVHPSGKTSYAVRYRHGGQPRKLTLQAGISLSAARKLCADALHEVAQGRDPAETKKAEKTKAIRAKADTVEAICTEFMQREGKKLRTGKARESALQRLVYPEIGAEQIDKIKRSQIVRLLDKVEDQNGPRQADSCLAYLRKIMNWHARRSDEFKSPIVRGMGRYNSKEHERSRVLTDGELRAVWQAAETADVFGSLLRFLLLTGARRAEAAEMKWAELDGKSWRVPAERNKTKQELTRPLSKAAQAIIAAQPQIDGVDFVFRQIGFSQAKKKFDPACGVSGWRVHDLRRTARTLLSRAGVNADIAERCLGHVVGGVRGVYDRHRYDAEMTHAFEALAAQIDRIVNPPTGDVVPLRRPAS